MGGGTRAMLPFHRAKLGAEGRLGVRAVRLVREEPHPHTACFPLSVYGEGASRQRRG